jgi:hypothetical protein
MSLDTVVYFITHFMTFSLLMTVNAGLIYLTVILFRRLAHV